MKTKCPECNGTGEIEQKEQSLDDEIKEANNGKRRGRKIA